MVPSESRASIGTLVKTSEREQRLALTQENREFIYPHQKIILCCNFLFQGSANLDLLSLVNNYETNVLLSASTDNGYALMNNLFKNIFISFFGDKLTAVIDKFGFFDPEKSDHQESIRAIQEHADRQWKDYLANDNKRDPENGFVVTMPRQRTEPRGCCPAFFSSARGTNGYSPVTCNDRLEYLPDTPDALRGNARRIWPKKTPVTFFMEKVIDKISGNARLESILDNLPALTP